MTQPDIPQLRYGRERTCPHCGTRVAQRARTCFFCGGSLQDRPRRSLSIPWADIVLFGVIGGLLVFWWTRQPTTSQGQLVSLIGRGTPSLSALATAAANADASLVMQPALAASLPSTPGLARSPAAGGGEPVEGATPQPAATTVPTATTAAGPIRHKVRSGDTVLLIAGLYGSTVKDIIEANGLSANGFLRVGQELVVPVPGPSGGPGPTATPSGGTLIYMVQEGDTVSSIAVRFGSRIDWIMNANKLKPNDLLHISQSLLVPLSNITPTPTPPVQVSPTPAPTAGRAFRAPLLLAPAEGGTVSGERGVAVSWASVGTLGEDEWYVVTLEIPGAEKAIAPYWTKATMWRLPPEYRVAGQSPTQFTWRVQVLTGSPGQPGQPASPPSASRRFFWE